MFRLLQSFNPTWCGLFLQSLVWYGGIMPPLLNPQKLWFFAKNSSEHQTYSKLSEKSQKSPGDVIMTSLWRHNAVFRTIFDSFTISFLFFSIDSKFCVSTHNSPKYHLLRFFENWTTWRQMTSHYVILLIFGIFSYRRWVILNKFGPLFA